MICLNGYPTELARLWRRNKDYDFSESTAYWKRELEKLHARYPDKPILITEFGYPTMRTMKPEFDGYQGPAMQRRAIEAEFAAFDASYICGATIWVWADHPWPKGAYLNETSPYGIFRRDRSSKGAGVEQAIEKMFRQRLQTRMPQLVSGPSNKSKPAASRHWTMDTLKAFVVEDAKDAEVLLAKQELCEGVVGQAVRFTAGSKGLPLGDLKLQAPATISFWLQTDSALRDARLLSQLEGPATQTGSLRV